MLAIAEVLGPEDLARVREALGRTRFKDGAATAGPAARGVKANRQADAADPATAALARFVRDAIERAPVFQLYARPARWSRLLFSRYAPGDAYGMHLDDPVMAADGGGRLRTDLSFTLFLSEPAAYAGGALVIDGLDGERELRLAAGALALYPTGALHRVLPVTAGERLACVGWVQSAIRRSDQREILFDLARAGASIEDAPARLLLDKSIGGLVRLWAET